MKTASIKARWAGKLMRSKNFVVITDTESVIFAEHTDPNSFDNYMTAHTQLAALRKFQIALNKATRDFEKGVSKKYEKPRTTKKPRKINVKVEK